MPGKISDQAKVNLKRIDEAKARGGYGPVKPTGVVAKGPNNSARQLADRLSQEKKLGLDRKRGYKGD